MQLWVLLFLSFFAIFGASALWMVRPKDKQTLERMIAAVNPGPKTTAPVFLKDARDPLGEPGGAFAGVPSLAAFVSAAQRAGVEWSLGYALCATVASAGFGVFAGYLFRGFLGPEAMYLGAVLFAAIPFLYVRRKSQRFLRAFEDQLPDAVDFLARSLRVGNALTISLEMMIPETVEPLRSEFLRVTRELTFGAPLDVAMKQLMSRVPLLEVRFLAAAILLQRETGGNLGEILDKLSLSVRERLRLKRQVRAASSQGRLTARVLSALPVLVFAMINLISPAYMHTMTHQPIGRAMLMAAVLSQIVGYLCMKKITNIEF
jgi:tight adherence protein B